MAFEKNRSNRQQMTVGPQLEICDFKDMQKTGTAELRLMPEKMSKFKEQNIRFRTYQDKDDVTWGIPLRVHSNGDIEWAPLRLHGDVIKFNLKIEREAKEWHIIKNSPFVKDSPTASIDARYIVYNPEAEAEKAVAEFDQILDAGAFIKSLDNNRIIAYGRLFGLSPDTNSVAVIKQALLEKAKKDPKIILMKKEKESETGILIVLKRAMAVGLLKTYNERGLVYNEQIGLGLTENTAIEFLRANPEVLVEMDNVSKQKDPFYKSSVEKSTTGKAKSDNFDE